MDTVNKNLFLSRKKSLERLMLEHALKVASDSENANLFAQFRIAAIHQEHALLLDFTKDHGLIL